MEEIKQEGRQHGGDKAGRQAAGKRQSRKAGSGEEIKQEGRQQVIVEVHSVECNSGSMEDRGYRKLQV